MRGPAEGRFEGVPQSSGCPIESDAARPGDGPVRQAEEGHRVVLHPQRAARRAGFGPPKLPQHGRRVRFRAGVRGPPVGQEHDADRQAEVDQRGDHPADAQRFVVRVRGEDDRAAELPEPSGVFFRQVFGAFQDGTAEVAVVAGRGGFLEQFVGEQAAGVLEREPPDAVHAGVERRLA